MQGARVVLLCDPGPINESSQWVRNLCALPEIILAANPNHSNLVWPTKSGSHRSVTS